MSFYELNLVVLVLLNAALFYRQRSKPSAKSAKADPDEKDPNEFHPVDSIISPVETGSKEFVKRYLIGHLLAFAGDWLQVCMIYICSDRITQGRCWG